MPHETVTLRTCDLIGAALDWAVAQVCVAQGSVSIDPHDAKSGLPYMTFDADGPCIWGSGREAVGTFSRETGKPWVIHGPGGRFKPSTDWSQGGPLLYQHRISSIAPGTASGVWWGQMPGSSVLYSTKGPDPLVAGLRRLVSEHLGDSVDVPAELVGGGV